MPHIHDKIDFTVEVFIVYRNKVLLRMHDKHKIWLSVGGHIELHEDPQEAAIREVMEEVGLDIKIDDRLKGQREEDETIELIPPYYLNKNRITETHSHITFVYFATAKTDKLIEATNNEKSEECRWFTKDEIDSNIEILPNIKFYALEALRILSV